MKFSTRNNYKKEKIPIKIRENAPKELQEFMIETAYHFGISPKYLRSIICRIIRKSPDIINNWSDFPNVDNENHELLENCEWFYIYDLIETLYDKLPNEKSTEFENDINDFFNGNGIGWQFVSGEIIFRGDDNFEKQKNEAVVILDKANKETARHEINEAIKDLSKKTSDITGAIQHSLAGLECVVREVAGDDKITLGALIKKYPHIVPKPLNVAIEKMWGYSSNMGRHLSESSPPDFDEAELLVSISASLISYLAKKNFKTDENLIDNIF